MPIDKAFIEAIQNKQHSKAKGMFEDELKSIIADKLESKKSMLAASVFEEKCGSKKSMKEEDDFEDDDDDSSDKKSSSETSMEDDEYDSED